MQLHVAFNYGGRTELVDAVRTIVRSRISAEKVDEETIGAALAGARRVVGSEEPHLAPWLSRWAECRAAPALFPPVPRHCRSFSQWWTKASRGLDTAADLLADSSGRRDG